MVSRGRGESRQSSSLPPPMEAWIAGTYAAEVRGPSEKYPARSPSHYGDGATWAVSSKGSKRSIPPSRGSSSARREATSEPTPRFLQRTRSRSPSRRQGDHIDARDSRPSERKSVHSRSSRSRSKSRRDGRSSSRGRLEPARDESPPRHQPPSYRSTQGMKTYSPYDFGDTVKVDRSPAIEREEASRRLSSSFRPGASYPAPVEDYQRILQTGSSGLSSSVTDTAVRPTPVVWQFQQEAIRDRMAVPLSSSSTHHGKSTSSSPSSRLERSSSLERSLSRHKSEHSLPQPASVTRRNNMARSTSWSDPSSVRRGRSPSNGSLRSRSSSRNRTRVAQYKYPSSQSSAQQTEISRARTNGSFIPSILRASRHQAGNKRHFRFSSSGIKKVSWKKSTKSMFRPMSLSGFQGRPLTPVKKRLDSQPSGSDTRIVLKAKNAFDADSKYSLDLVGGDQDIEAVALHSFDGSFVTGILTRKKPSTKSESASKNSVEDSSIVDHNRASMPKVTFRRQNSSPERESDDESSESTLLDPPIMDGSYNSSIRHLSREANELQEIHPDTIELLEIRETVEILEERLRGIGDPTKPQNTPEEIGEMVSTLSKLQARAAHLTMKGRGRHGSVRSDTSVATGWLDQIVNSMFCIQDCPLPSWSNTGGK